MMGSTMPTICSETVVIISVMFLPTEQRGGWAYQLRKGDDSSTKFH